MITRKHFQTRLRIIDPDVIKPIEINGRMTFAEVVAPGKFYLVKPKTAYEIAFISMLDHHRDKFAPKVYADSDRGEGVLISDAAMAKIDA